MAESSFSLERVFVQLKKSDGTQIGQQMGLPLDVTTEQLDGLIQKVEKTEDRIRYNYYIGEAQLTDCLSLSFLERLSKTREEILKITCRPEKMFYVQPVTAPGGVLYGHSECVVCAAFSPDGQRLASGSGDCSVRLWDLLTKTPKTKEIQHSEWVLCVSWNTQGTVLASGGMDGNLFLWDGENGRRLDAASRKHRAPVTTICWEPRGGLRVVSGSKDGLLKIWTFSTDCLFVLSQHTAGITSVRWGLSGMIFSASQDRTIIAWCPEKGSSLFTLTGHSGWINVISLSSDSLCRGWSGLEDNEEAERLASGSDDFTVCLWEPQKQLKPAKKLQGHQGTVIDVKFSPNGRLLASSSFDKTVFLWNGFTGERLSRFAGHVGRVYQLAWAPDSAHLASISQDSTVKIWDCQRRKWKGELSGHQDEVYAVDWSGDGKVLCSGGKDRTLRLWRE